MKPDASATTACDVPISGPVGAPSRSGGPTLKQVALEAGVSVGLVSKVLHGRGSTIRVSQERAKAVREAAARLRYRPNVVARQLRMSRTNTIGLMWDRMQRIADGPMYYVLLLDGVAAKLFENHYSLMILPEVPADGPIASLCDRRLDGMIWCKMPHEEALFEEIHHSNLAVVALNSAPPRDDLDVPFISCDNEGGSELVAGHLTSLGHRRILFALDAGWQSAPDAWARLNGFRTAMAKRNLPFGDEDIAEWFVTPESIGEWWESRPPHTAIFAWHEGLAGKILAAAEVCGIPVPEAFSVVGFDSTRFCESTKPRLTAVRQPIREMAESAAQLLVELIAGNAPRTSQSFPCTLDVRDSTSSPSFRLDSCTQR